MNASSVRLLGLAPAAEAAVSPEISDDGVFRRLHFGRAYVQSEMRLDDPDALCFAYTRRMMAFLLFQPRPRHVVIVGLGGGSLTKFCHRHLPQTRITTVEIDARVIALRTQFGVPDPDPRLAIVHADAVDYFAGGNPRANVVLLDGCDDRGVAEGFRNPRFYANLRKGLRPGGLLIANLPGDAARVEAHLELMREAFAGRSFAVTLDREGSRLGYAFNDPWQAPDWTQLQRKARTLSAHYGLDFPQFLREMKRGWEQRRDG
jgi:spermidine synthase